MSKSLIWCEVICSCCGGMANASGYYSEKRIKKLKDETKNWILDNENNILCDVCKEKMKNEQE